LEVPETIEDQLVKVGQPCTNNNTKESEGSIIHMDSHPSRSTRVLLLPPTTEPQGLAREQNPAGGDEVNEIPIIINL